MTVHGELADAGTPVATLADLHAEAAILTRGAPEGDELDTVTVALIELAVHAAVTSLDIAGMDRCVGHALDVGASPAQVHETLVVVSGLGVHTLMEGSRLVAEAVRERGEGDPALDDRLNDERAALRSRMQGDDPYWVDFERQVPGFLDSLLRLSPEAYEAFFDYCAVPWRSGAVRGRVKELMSMATDSTPTHRYTPGMRMHLANALRLGAGRLAIMQALRIGSLAPFHPGVRPSAEQDP